MAKSTLIVSNALLINLLCLPENTEILGADIDIDDLLAEQVKFVISHPDIPENKQSIKPSLVSHYDKKGHITKIEFVGWN